IGVLLQSLYIIYCRVNCMGQDLKIRIVLEFIVYLIHVAVHLGTNAFAGGKEILCNKNFPLHILLRNQLTILICKKEWLDITQDRKFFSAKIGYQADESEIKASHQQCEKDDIKPGFLTH